MTAIKDTSKKETWKMFDLIASRYDLLNRVLSFGIDVWWRYRLGFYLPVTKTPQKVLDIATGTGDVGLSLLRNHPKRVGEVVGVDLAEEMLDKADKKIQSRNIPNMSVKVGDATNLPIETDSVDATTIAFGIRNVPDVPKALEEMKRVIKPGGRALILEFSIPRFFLFKWFYLFYFRYILPTVGGLVSGNKKAYSYLNSSVEAFPDGQDFLDLMNDAGFTNTKATSLTFGIASIYQGDA
jgi:demethylmenaquinone methyltransferase/2-methoxy-6-polyprenyl-1,4-benzoquinol methylase